MGYFAIKHLLVNPITYKKLVVTEDILFFIFLNYLSTMHDMVMVFHVVVAVMTDRWSI